MRGHSSVEYISYGLGLALGLVPSIVKTHKNVGHPGMGASAHRSFEDSFFFFFFFLVLSTVMSRSDTTVEHYGDPFTTG